MKIVKATLVLMALIGFFSCERKSCCTIIDVHFYLTVLNQQGQNLLAAPAIYTKSNIETYHVIDGKPQLFDQPHLNANKGFLVINEGSGKNVIQVFPYFNKKEKRSTTLIKFGDLEMDTIECEFRFSGASVFLEKVWHNGELKSKSFIVVK